MFLPEDLMYGAVGGAVTALAAAAGALFSRTYRSDDDLNIGVGGGVFHTLASLASDFRDNVLHRTSNRMREMQRGDLPFAEPDRGFFGDFMVAIAEIVFWLLRIKPPDTPGASSPAQAHTPGKRLHRVLDCAGFFIPKSVREPFWRDLIDDRDQMVKRGKSSWFIRCAVASQIMALLFMALKDVVVKTAIGAPKTPRE